jgi:hypothetical protein
MIVSKNIRRGDRELALLNALRKINRVRFEKGGPTTKQKLRGAALGYEGIMELINLLQNSGFFSKGGKVESSGLANLLGE